MKIENMRQLSKSRVSEEFTHYFSQSPKHSFVTNIFFWVISPCRWVTSLSLCFYLCILSFSLTKKKELFFCLGLSDILVYLFVTLVLSPLQVNYDWTRQERAKERKSERDILCVYSRICVRRKENRYLTNCPLDSVISFRAFLSYSNKLSLSLLKLFFCSL